MATAYGLNCWKMLDHEPTMVEKAAKLGEQVRSGDEVGTAIAYLRSWKLLPAVTAETEVPQAPAVSLVMP